MNYCIEAKKAWILLIRSNPCTNGGRWCLLVPVGVLFTYFNSFSMIMQRFHCVNRALTFLILDMLALRC